MDLILHIYLLLSSTICSTRSSPKRSLKISSGESGTVNVGPTEEENGWMLTRSRLDVHEVGREGGVVGWGLVSPELRDIVEWEGVVHLRPRGLKVSVVSLLLV